ncbi:ankyrin repeat [Fusarium albosuccineum]|uniref:Ankyrin repeat n=1 Tax=Fusarium albosuccineum TaxID=1237068 RepID=A0A8H4PAY5_9HYPO|nr:ankyrin repeat [Fusarium albosuccineum]
MTQAYPNEDHEFVEKELLVQPEERSNINDTGYTSLHTAVISGNASLVQTLLGGGCDLDARDRNWNTPLHLAVMRDNVNIVERLLDAGANPELVNHHGDFPHDLARRNLQNGYEIMSALTFATAWLNSKLERFGDNSHIEPSSTDFQQLRDAIEIREGETIQKIMTVIRPVDYPKGMVAAALGGHVGVLEWLLEQGANPDPIPIPDASPLVATPILAAIGGREAYIVQRLLDFSHDGRFDPTRMAAGVSYSELAWQRQGPHCEVEVRLLKLAQDAWSKMGTRSKGAWS